VGETTLTSLIAIRLLPNRGGAVPAE